MRIQHWLLIVLMGAPALAEAGPAGDAAMRFHRQVKAIGARATSARLKTVVDKGADVKGIYQRAMDGRDASLTAAQQFRLAAASKGLLRHRFHSTIHDMPRIQQPVRERPTGVDTTVTFETKEGTKTVEIDYVMHKVEGNWHVRDIITEGVSLAKNYKYEINRLYKKDGPNGAAARVEAKVRALDGGR